MQIGCRLVALLLAMAVLSSAAAADKKPAPAEMKFAAMVIWGTDGEKPNDKKLHDVDKPLKEKFEKVFKWKNYYQVGEKKKVTLQPGDRKNLEMSDKCLVKLNWDEKKGLELGLIGEGKVVETRTFGMPPTDILVLGGGDKNENAWFVVLQPE